jgi:hypothetical protein
LRPTVPKISPKLEKVGLTEEITLKGEFDQLGDGSRIIRTQITGGKLRRLLSDGTLGSFKGDTLDFVITMDGRLIIGRGHSLLANGKSVRFAGRIKTNREGVITDISNDSGHYLPEAGKGLTDKAKNFLANEGLDVSKAKVSEVGG